VPTKWRNHTPVQCWAELVLKIKKEHWVELPACHTLVQIYLLGMGLKNQYDIHKITLPYLQQCKFDPAVYVLKEMD